MPSSPPLVNLSLGAFLAASIPFVVLASLFVITRATGNLQKTKRFYLEDGISVISILLLAAAIGLVHAIALQFRNPEPSTRLLKLGLSCYLVTTIAMWSAKIPIVLILLRLFGINKWLRITSYVIMIGPLILFLVCMIVTGIRCRLPPIEDDNLYLVLAASIRCSDIVSLSGIIQGSVCVAMDVAIFILPLPVLSQLHLPARQKIGLFIVFLSGLVAIAASSTSLYFQTFPFAYGPDKVIGLMRMLAFIIECSIAITVGCVPATYAFWNGYVVKSAIYLKIRQVLSSSTGAFVRSFTKSSKGTTSAHSLNISVVHGYPVRKDNNHEYMQMESKENINRPVVVGIPRGQEEV
ncbi:hypothetical protein QBC43DRAFT_38756 [Cladorrhinum sp. PSN259]|nr:hypothetical protein QBC43DRAFT_38756 [Cladorrhinum sp. PSN259]